MKNLFLFLSAILLVGNCIAQKTFNHIPIKTISISGVNTLKNARTTGVGDTLMLSNIPQQGDTLALYTAGTDSGFITGTDAYGDKGFAERYDINGADSSVQVIGVEATFGGSVNPASTKLVNFKVWSQGPQVSASFTDPNLFYSGFPNAVLDSVSVPITQIGIPDTLRTHLFAVPTGTISSSFFTGYDINYDFASLNGDTIGLFSTAANERTSPIFTVSGTDTIINDQNVTEYINDSWHDNAVDNFHVSFDLLIFPIVVIDAPTGITTITKNNLTFYGNYPNPAMNSTNVKFSLNNPADVSIKIIDMNGRTLNTIQQTNVGRGTHVISLSISDLAAGNYICLVRTSDNDGIAEKITVIK